ncbi:50S ribosomal protein L21 [candidate division WOR-3 bacterium]|uniref:Large ribosomal subunit protein bL21 n=1 Tax=candidate division WOR-3 bacterium TaxID=2052148 RepID=A0A660SL00_UNCW3|nr:MAG: 50S ribosomal protein L21 [candidate division WOR-3 bacterium]
MFAVVRIKGFQYLVKPGDEIIIPARIGKEGEEIKLGEVLLYQDDGELHVGRPVLDDVEVKGKIVQTGRMDKILVFKYKRKKNYRRLTGHRQDFSRVRISEIVAH